MYLIMVIDIMVLLHLKYFQRQNISWFYHDSTPRILRNFSKDNQNVIDHGAIRSQHGMKPL